ncbi:MAG: PHP-associated domain-containing protein [Nitrospinota bacterium]
MKLKADLHIHTREDPKERITYNAEELISLASDKGFDVISITNHNIITFNDHLRDYAEKKGILLIPGMEASIKGRHVLLINWDDNGKEIKTFDEIRRYKNCKNLVIAPHPYYPGAVSLKSRLVKHIDIFDAVEYSHFYLKWINFNSKGMRKAAEKGLPLIGTSDAHAPWQLETTYTFIHAEKKTVESVVDAVKAQKVEIITIPLKLRQTSKFCLRALRSLTLCWFEHFKFNCNGNGKER